MGWVRVDDSFYDHQKFIDVGPLGIAQWVVGLAWCNRNLSDGFIPSSRAHHLLDWDGIAWHMWSGELVGGGEDADGEDISHTLVRAGVWEKIEGGYLIHDYHEYQPTAEEVKSRQEEIRATKARAGQVRAAGAIRASTGQFVSAGQTSTTSTATSTTTSSQPAPTPTPIVTTKYIGQSALENDFGECWEIYPRKVARKDSFTAYGARRKEGISHADLLTATRNFARAMKGRDSGYILQGKTFFGSNERWKDYLDNAPGTLEPKPSTPSSGPVNRSRSDTARGDVQSYKDQGLYDLAEELQTQIDNGDFE